MVSTESATVRCVLRTRTQPSRPTTFGGNGVKAAAADGSAFDGDAEVANGAAGADDVSALAPVHAVVTMRSGGASALAHPRRRLACPRARAASFAEANRLLAPTDGSADEAEANAAMLPALLW